MSDRWVRYAVYYFNTLAILGSLCGLGLSLYLSLLLVPHITGPEVLKAKDLVFFSVIILLYPIFFMIAYTGLKNFKRPLLGKWIQLFYGMQIFSFSVPGLSWLAAFYLPTQLRIIFSSNGFENGSFHLHTELKMKFLTAQAELNISSYEEPFFIAFDVLACVFFIFVRRLSKKTPL